MTSLINGLRLLHDGFFGTLERGTDGWFLGLFTRLAFLLTLYIYYLNSARTKIGDGLLGFLTITDGAYIQIAGPAFEAAGYEQGALPLPAHIMVFMGTHGEFILPVLVVLGLFARIGALGMIGFIFVQTHVDVSVHQVALGALFNGQPGELIDQRLFWMIPLVYIALKGPGAISFDNILSRWWTVHFGALERVTDGWFLGLFTRLAFLLTLYIYYLNSARTKIGDGLLGFLTITDGAYIQIAGPAFEAAGYEQGTLPLPAHVMVFMGTYGEFILPVLVVLGLFARIGALGMIGFIFVQTHVDVSVHQVALGTLFNGQPGELIDQRLFWMIPLIYIALKGPGATSFDNALSRWWTVHQEKSFGNKIASVAGRAGRKAIKMALKLYYALRDRDTPITAKVTIASSLGYFIFPIDAIPDFLLIIGYTDDVGVMAAALVTVANHIKPEHDKKAQDWVRRNL